MHCSFLTDALFLSAMDSSTVDTCSIPAGKSPNGVYNFVDPPSLGVAVIAVGVVLGAISTALAVGRLYINRSRLHAADIFTIMACLTNIAYTGVIAAHPNYYRHSWDIPVCWYTGEYLRFPFVQTILFFPAFFFPKGAIFLLYKQLFAIGKRMRVAIDVGLLVTLLVYLSNVPLAAIYAAPRVGHSWESLLESLQTNSHPFALGGAIQSAIGTVLDIYILILPLHIVWHLQMPLGKRLQLVGVFSTAILGIAASIVSLVFKIQILSSTDSSWLAGITSMCSLIEVNIAIIVGCMPAFAQIVSSHVIGSSFFRSLRTRLLGSSDGRGSSRSKSGSNKQAQGLVTFGARQTPRRVDPYEMTDTTLLNTKATAVDDDPRETGSRSEAQSTRTSEAEQATEQRIRSEET